jgi:hypothetical protein
VLLNDGRNPNDNGESVTRRLLAHLHQHLVGYIALVVAVVGSGGSYAVAATSRHTSKHHPTTLSACVNDRTGEMILDRTGRCRRGRHRVTWDVTGRRGATGPAGSPAPSIYAAVDAALVANNTQPSPEKGMTVQSIGTGSYLITITDPVCAIGENVPVVTPSAHYLSGGAVPPVGAVPVAYVSEQNSLTQFTIQTGFDAGGSLTPEGLDFFVQDTCMPSSSDSVRP